MDEVKQELVEALKAFRAAHSMSQYGDYSDFVFPDLKERVPGNSAWGTICAKHGLGYGGGCICCADDIKAHRATKDREARSARNDALRAADELASAALAKASN